MNYQVIVNDNQKYIRLNDSGSLIRTEAEALELLSACSEHETDLLLIPGIRLSEEFFQLRTGIAGAILQKFALYRIKCAVVLNQDVEQGRFREFLIESNKGNSFRFYASVSEAEAWLLSQK